MAFCVQNHTPPPSPAYRSHSLILFKTCVIISAFYQHHRESIPPNRSANASIVSTSHLKLHSMVGKLDSHRKDFQCGPLSGSNCFQEWKFKCAILLISEVSLAFHN